MFEFSTNVPSEARRRLKLPEFAWLPESAHEVVIKHVERGACRVQDPMMHKSPTLSILDEVAKAEILEAIGGPDGFYAKQTGEIPQSVSK